MYYFLAFLVLTLVLLRSASRSRKPNFPGPHGWPILGNSLQVPASCSWTWFEEIYKSYGPIVSIAFGGENYILLSKPRDAEELLEKRSANFSGRKQAVFAAKYRSNNKRMLLLPHGSDLKTQRAMFKLMLRPNALASYHSREEQQLSRLLYDIVESPAGYHQHLYRYTASIVMAITYGTGIKGNDADLEAILESNRSFNLDALPGAHLVDTFPWLDYLPDFLAPWRQEAIQKHNDELKLFSRLAYNVKLHMDTGPASECFIAQVWRSQKKYGLDDETVAYLGGSSFEAGTSVTACLLHSFLLACIRFPHFIAKARAELDSVSGKEPPRYEQMKSMPYVFSVVKEAFRWIPATPLAFPHKADVDDEYQGHKIPAGTFIIPSIWNMHRDPENYKDPSIFEPARWYNPDESGCVKPSSSLVEGHWTFGFGRRQCPANYLAVELVWGAIASLLWAFDITKAKHPETGMEIEVDPETIPWLDGVNIEPAPFPVSIQPRSKSHAEKIKVVWLAISMADGNGA